MVVQFDLSFNQLRSLRDLLLSRIEKLDVEFHSLSDNSEICNDDRLHELNQRHFELTQLFNALFG